MSPRNDSRFRYPLFLVAFNAVAHFVPFERASLAPDDYASLLRSLSIPGFDLAAMMRVYQVRPLTSAVTMLQAKVFSDGTTGPLVALFLASSAVLVAAFALLRLVLGSPRLAFAGAILFGLLPNKLETYHASVQVFVNLGNLHYLLSFVFFVLFTRRRAGGLLLASLVLYTLGVFSYEVGFFAPIVFLVYSWLYDRKSMPKVLLFALPAAAYAGYRLLGIEMSHAVEIGRLRPLVTLFHQYAGGHLALALLNGASGFVAMPWQWIGLAVLGDVLILWIVHAVVIGSEIPKIGRRERWLALSMFVLFLLPLFLQRQGGIAGRHLTLPSLGVVIAVLAGLQGLGHGAKPALLGLVAAGLIVSQGNGWAQVVACRINAALYQTMKEMREPLASARHVVVDVHSFREAIPSSWVRFDWDFLNSYYGAQTFEDWSIESMARLASGDPAKEVHLAVEEPAVTEEGLLSFTEGRRTGSRSFSTRRQAMPADNAVVIDFKSVYRTGFQAGERGRRP